VEQPLRRGTATHESPTASMLLYPFSSWLLEETRDGLLIPQG